jgi:endonuclease V-like protein UPF0215 family
VCARTRLDGVNVTDALIALVVVRKFREHIRAVLLQGIALAGFIVVDTVIDRRAGLPPA